MSEKEITLPEDETAPPKFDELPKNVHWERVKLVDELKIAPPHPLDEFKLKVLFEIVGPADDSILIAPPD